MDWLILFVHFQNQVFQIFFKLFNKSIIIPICQAYQVEGITVLCKKLLKIVFGVVKNRTMYQDNIILKNTYNVWFFTQFV